MAISCVSPSAVSRCPSRYCRSPGVPAAPSRATASTFGQTQPTRKAAAINGLSSLSPARPTAPLFKRLHAKTGRGRAGITSRPTICPGSTALRPASTASTPSSPPPAVYEAALPCRRGRAEARQTCAAPAPRFCGGAGTTCFSRPGSTICPESVATATSRSRCLSPTASSTTDTSSDSSGSLPTPEGARSPAGRCANGAVSGGGAGRYAPAIAHKGRLVGFAALLTAAVCRRPALFTKRRPALPAFATGRLRRSFGRSPACTGAGPAGPKTTTGAARPAAVCYGRARRGLCRGRRRYACVGCCFTTVR